MRLATRIGVGAALAVLPLVGVVAYTVDGMRQVAEHNERLTDRQALAGRVAEGILARLHRLEEYHRKFSISSDPGYALKFVETRDAVSAALADISAGPLSAAESAALAELTAEWKRFAERDALSADADDFSASIAGLSDLADDVRRESAAAAMEEIVAATMIRDDAGRTALVVSIVATVLSLVVVALTIRSVHRRLRQFIAGTEAVSQGTLGFQLDAHADDELGRVARAFNRMISALQQLERMKADFVSSVSHELRTPLVAMLETTQVLLDEVPGPLTAQQRRMLDLNQRAGVRLSSMISDLLELSRLRATIRYQFSEQELVSLTRIAAMELEALADDRGLTLARRLPDREIRACCDPDRWVQVVQNLLENAVKYTPATGRIEITLDRCGVEALPAHLQSSLLRRGETFALLRVEDTGVGIAEADRERVFEKFFRRHGQPSDGGAGLGLAICREIVQAHGGRIWVDEGRLGGACVSVALPVDPLRSRTAA